MPIRITQFLNGSHNDYHLPQAIQQIIRNADTKLFDDLGYDDILWIDMLLPTIKEQKAVENFMEISLQTKQQVEEIESTSKYSETENAIISNSNFFVPTGESFLVEPVSFIISNEGVLVSVRNAEFRTFRETEKRLQMNYRSYSTGYHSSSRCSRCASTSTPTWSSWSPSR